MTESTELTELTQLTGLTESTERASALVVDDPSVAECRTRDDRYRGVYASFWLIFLGFSLYALVVGSDPLALKIIGVALICVFSVVYIVGNARAANLSTHAAWVYLAVLTAILLASVPILGPNALAFAPFVCSWAAIMLPLRWGIAVTAFWALVSLAVAATVASEALKFTIIIISVGSFTIAIAMFTESGNRLEDMRLQTQLTSDRERVARDVHDVLGHSLTAVVVKSELAQRLIATDPDAARRELAEIEALSRSALAEIRTTVDGLRTTRLRDELETARQVLSSAGIELITPDNVDDVDPRANVTMAWVVREATTNIVRHSGARRATIRWGSDWIEVTDDGRGLSDAVNETETETDNGMTVAVRHGHTGHGLVGLRERVAAVGGTLTFGTGPGGIGTRLRAQQR